MKQRWVIFLAINHFPIQLFIKPKVWKGLACIIFEITEENEMY